MKFILKKNTFFVYVVLQLITISKNGVFTATSCKCIGTITIKLMYLLDAKTISAETICVKYSYMFYSTFLQNILGYLFEKN